ncbi:hypothetical protein [Sphaerisporangium corydalis]|uniref:Tat pathway signal sequence domain protein n=1 Tax=Sphaerisporangium corydalis TaxID=1441875 RepID=A0ABV9EHE5_9ACTN|nr:hypothetical protein [Sphaerisporangium corydalis]
MTPTIRSSRRRRTVAALAACGAAAAITTFALGEPASALPAPQAKCDARVLSFVASSAVYVGIADPITVEVPATTTLKVEVTADVSVQAGAEFRLAYTLNDTFPPEGTFGPANFANHQEFAETRSTFALITVGPGRSTIKPLVRINGPAGKTGFLLHRCFTVEATTS